MSGHIYDCGEGDACLHQNSRIRHVRITGGAHCYRCPDYYASPAYPENDVEAFTLYHRIFCSAICALKWREEMLAAEREPAICRVCAEQSSNYAGVCLDCINEAREATYLPLASLCVICSEAFIPLNGEGTCSDSCTQEARRELSHRRRAREIDAFVADVNRAEVFKRDDYTCQLCYLPVDMSLTFPHRMSPTIDHIIPLAVGGTHEPDNVQAAHFGCNAAKGARVPIPS